MIKAAAHLLASLGLLTLHTHAAAQHNFAAPVNFVISQSCEATTAIRQPGSGKPVKPGEVYKATGQNRATNPTHVFITGNDKYRWIALECGKLGAPAPAPAALPQPVVANEADRQQACAVFFDNVDNPVATDRGLADVTPPPPVLDEFDNAVLSVCDAPGKHTSKDEFINMMKQNPAVLDKLMAFTGNMVQGTGPALAKDAYLQQLANVWYERGGFDHLFCGHDRGRKVGGLHFHGRYLQLQKKALLCRLDGRNDQANNEVEAGLVYSMGVSMRFGNKTIRDPLKGYGYTLSASDILLSATRAFAENPISGTGNAACLLKLKDGNKQYAITFVRTSAGLVTFYPDATPKRNAQQCSKGIALP
jgi:Bacterial EndoU nuclease